MQLCILLIFFVIDVKGCAPSVPSNNPVLNSTVTPISSTTEALSSSTTSPLATTETTSTIPSTTTIFTSTITVTTPVVTTPTTTTVTTTPTTTVAPCCSYPFLTNGDNTADPSQTDWTMCQNISLSCYLSNGTVGTYTNIAVLGDYNTTSPVVINQVSATQNTSAIITCDRTNLLWHATTGTALFANVTCGYFTSNGWVTNA